MGLINQKEDKRPGIKQRWIAGCLSVTVIIVLAALVGFLVYAFNTMERQTAIRAALIAGTAAIAAVGAIAWVNLRFIRSVTGPALAITDAAKRIARGSYGVQIEKLSDDELGELTDSINEMSERIARGEKLQTEFISSISHELRTPLTAITGWAEALEYDQAIQGESRRGVSIIGREAGRLTKMVGELLEFTRIQDGRFNLDVETLDIAAEVEDVVFTYGKLLGRDGVELRCGSIEGDVPMVDGDPERLKQVLLNIIDNAAKYGSSGGVIEVSMDFDSRWVRVYVRDHGPGIPAEELPKVKEKFYKGSSKARGSGIGLAVCEEIVTRHGGKLSIENAADGGVLATVELPVSRHNN